MTRFIVPMLVALAIAGTPRSSWAFEVYEFLREADKELYKFFYTPCERHERKVADRKKQRKEELERIKKRKIAEEEQRTREESPEWQQRAKRQAELRELLVQPTGRQTELSLGSGFMDEQLALQDELETLQEADERAILCGPD